MDNDCYPWMLVDPMRSENGLSSMLTLMRASSSRMSACHRGTGFAISKDSPLLASS